MATRKRCKGTNRRGEQCGNWIEVGDFCGWHELEDEERKVVVKILQKSKDNLPAFLAGAFAEAFIGDVYELMKGLIIGRASGQEDLGVWTQIGKSSWNTLFDNLISLSEVQRFSQQYRQEGDLDSLRRLSLLLRLGITGAQIRKMLGEPVDISSLNDGNSISRWTYEGKFLRNGVGEVGKLVILLYEGRLFDIEARYGWIDEEYDWAAHVTTLAGQ